MAHIHTEELTINVMQLVKESGAEVEILSPEIREAIAMLVVPMIEEIVGTRAVVEIK